MTSYTKQPWLAAVLSIIFYGLGHLYVGKRKLFGGLMVGTGISVLIWYFTAPGAMEASFNIWMLISSILINIALATDAYREAKTTIKNTP